MNSRMTMTTRRGRAILATATAAGALVAAATAIASTQPLAGPYAGTVNGTGAHNKGEGCFQEKPTVFGKRVKPVQGQGTICNNQIIAPSRGPVDGPKKYCNKKPAILNSGGFPISQQSFHYKGKAAIGKGGKKLTVDFQGQWKSRTHVVGTTKISGGGCKSTVKWTMDNLVG